MDLKLETVHTIDYNEVEQCTEFGDISVYFREQTGRDKQKGFILYFVDKKTNKVIQKQYIDMVDKERLEFEFSDGDMRGTKPKIVHSNH